MQKNLFRMLVVAGLAAMSGGTFAAPLTVASASAAAAGVASCDRVQRQVANLGEPMEVSVAQGHFTEVVFPEPLAAILPEKPDGLRFYENAFPDRLFFTVDDSAYRSMVIVQGQGGTSYHLQINSVPGCPDSTVQVVRGGVTGPTPVPKEQQKQGRKLVEYMITGETPPGYTREKVQGPLSSRLVLQQGSVKFYLSEIYKGFNYTGTVLLAVNEGRTPYRVAIEAIDFATPDLRDAMGRVSEVSMYPYDLRLGPSPEYAADANQPSHQGMLFVVSENATHGR